MVAHVEIPDGTVTVLFTDLVSSTALNQQLGDDAARAIGREVERSALERIEGHRGVVIKSMGDGVMAAFSSARRAVVCAREIQSDMRSRNRRLPERTAQMRIGLHTGEVIEEDGDIHGETVIIAQRIESLAPPGGILVSESVHMLLGTARNDLEDRGEHELRGIEDRWRLFEVPCDDDDSTDLLAQSTATPFVGRSRERGQLVELIARVADGAGAMVVISGETGIGKSRMVDDALDEARRRRLNALVGACVDMDVPPPYQPLIDQLEQASRQTSPEQMRAALGENAPEVATLMPSLRQRYDDIPAPPSLPPEQERRYLLHGLEEFLHRVSGNRPLVLVFEDLHWADESTLLLLEHIAPTLPATPILVIGTFRPTDLESDRPFARSYPSLVRARHVVELALGPLARDEVAAVVRHRAGRPPPDALVDLIGIESRGNPLFVEELLRHLHEGGRLFDDGGEWRPDIELGESEVPRTVALLVGRRLDRLTPATRRLLATAAVIGTTFSFDLLTAVARGVDRDLTDDELFDALEEADALHLVTEMSDGGHARYGFVHSQFRQTLLAELSLARRQRLHIRVADALEASVKPGASTPWVDVAHHLELAGSAAPPERAGFALVEAARSALTTLAFEDALRSLDRATSHLDGVDPDGWAEAMALRARALRGSGRIDDALDALDQALVGVPEHGATRSAILLQRSRLLDDQFRAAEALDDLRALLDVHVTDGDRGAELETLLELARAEYIVSLDMRDVAERSRATYEAAYDLAVELDDRRSMARALIPTVWFTDYWVEYRSTAHDNAQRAVELASALGDEDLLIDAEHARLRGMNLAEMLPLAEGLLERLERRRDPVRIKEHCFWMMWGSFASARFDRCVELCDRGLELAELLGSAPVQYGSIKAMALSHGGRFDEVDHALAQEVTDDEHPFGQAMAQLARTEHLVVIGALGQAASVGIDALRRADDLSRAWMQHWLVSLLTSVRARLDAAGGNVPIALTDRLDTLDIPVPTRVRAEVQLRTGRPDEARRLVEPAVAELSEQQRLRELSDARLVLVEALLALDDAPEAARVGREAIDHTRSCSYDTATWQFRMLLAEALTSLGDDTEADRQRAAALAEFEVLRERIADPDLRTAFERQPLAPR